MHASDKSVLRGRCNKFRDGLDSVLLRNDRKGRTQNVFRVMFECVSYNVLCVLAASHGVWISSQGQWHVQS